MRIKNILLLIVFVCLAFGCASTPKTSYTPKARPTVMDGKPFDAAKDANLRAEASPDKQDKAKLAKEGIAAANDCIMKDPEEAGCYYYRALNTGTYYSAHVIGYQDGLKDMIKDCEKVIKLNDKFDHGGAYRTIGKIYTDVPETTMKKNGITRDLDKALT